jgi:hypothetical protein
MRLQVFMMTMLVAASMSVHQANAATPPSGLCAMQAQQGAAIPKPVPTASEQVTPLCSGLWPKLHEACTVALTHNQACTPCENLLTAYIKGSCIGQ